MQFWDEGVSGWFGVCRDLFWRLVLVAFFVVRVLGQTGQTAMQDSIQRQQQAVLAAQQEAQRGSLAQQHASLRRQHQDGDIGSLPPAPSTTSGSFSDSFFSAHWDPGPAEVDMPNVRVPTTACPALADEEVEKLTNAAAEKNSVSAKLIRAVMRQESAFRPCAVSTAGAMGLMQIMPATAETLGLQDAFSPGENVEAGARYLKQLLDRYHGDRRLALGAYNAGPNRVDNAGGIPDIPETMDYVSRILGEVPDEEASSGGPDIRGPAFEMPVEPAIPSIPPSVLSFPSTVPAPPRAP
jgi:soluble lytic murein transglycosylase-like protein